MKKQTKKQTQTYHVTHTRTQKICGWAALVALFICGVMVGNSLNSKPNNTTNVPEIIVQETITDDVPAVIPQETCALIEESLLAGLPNGDKFTHIRDRIERANIYARLSEHGCAENAQQYRDLAKQELAIARALADDEFEQYETIEVVETYKRLNMQAAAKEIFETAKKLTNPTIDFILTVEKIINEQ